MKNREIYFNLSLLAGSFIFISLLLVSAEWGVRAVGAASHQGKENFRVHWAQLAEETGVYQPEAGVINRLGFHSPEVPVRKPKGALRILVLGGSAVYGWKEIETSWVWALEQRLKNRYPDRKVEVLNAGISGGRSTEEISLLSNLVFLEPDLVIVYDGWNDIYGSQYCPDWYRSKAQDVLEDDPASFSAQFNQWLEHHSYLYLSIKKNFYAFRKKLKAKRKARKSSSAVPAIPPGTQTPAVTGDPSAFEKKERTVLEGVTTVRCAEEVPYRLRPSGDLPDTFSEIYLRNLETMAELSHRHGAGFIAFLQPSLAATADEGTIPAEAAKILRETNTVFYEDWRNAVKQLYPKARQVFTQLKKSGIPAYDFSTLLSGGRSLYFTDDVHYRDPVILEQIAAEIETWLDEERLLPKS